MKTPGLLTLLLLLAIAQNVLADSDVGVSKQTKGQDVFAVKTERRFVGGTVEVFYSNGEPIIRQTLKKRKVEIDFTHVRFGEYIIRITNNMEEQEYRYVKK